jgi:hypothetical protein
MRKGGGKMPDFISINNKKYTGDQFEAGVNQVKYICPGKRGIFFGFNDQTGFLAWAKEQGIEAKVQDTLTKEAQIKARVDKNIASDAKWKEIQTKQYEFHNWQVQQALKLVKVKPTELKPATRNTINRSLYINVSGALVYDRMNYTGSWQYLWYGWHPKLSWYDFNDKIDSVRLWSDTVSFYQHTWFQGWCLVLLTDLPYLGWFCNRISSATVG